jgi:hypothetical protein
MKIPHQMCYTYTAGMINEHVEQTAGAAWKQTQVLKSSNIPQHITSYLF